MSPVFHREWLLPLYWWKKIFWLGLDGTVITVRWLSLKETLEWQVWLEKYVGKKGWAWDWRTSVNPNNPYELRFGLLDIKFRPGNEEAATYVMLKWPK